MLLRWGSLLGLAFLCVSKASACFAPPQDMYLSKDNAVEKSEIIYLGTVVGVKRSERYWTVFEALEGAEFGWLDSTEYGYPYEYTFRVDECVKGECGTTMTRTGEAPQQPPMDDYSTGSALARTRHESSSFWRWRNGRVTNSPDCELHPTFNLGAQYLVFSQQELSLGVERISYEDDAWLSYVRDRSANFDPTPLYPKSASTYFRDAVTIAIIDQRGSDTKIEILKGEPNALGFMKGPLEHPDAVGFGGCEARERRSEYLQSTGRHYLLVVEQELQGARSVRINCKSSATGITYWTSYRDENRTLSATGMSRFSITNDQVEFPDKMLVGLPWVASTKRGRKINKIAVDDLREMLENNVGTQETSQ